MQPQPQPRAMAEPAASPRSIDLAAVFGEFFVLPPAGVPLVQLAGLQVEGQRLHPGHGASRDDVLLLPMVSTGYVACGGHSGDALAMGLTVRMLQAQGMAIGAYASYPDVFGFGQTPLDVSDNQLEDLLLVQVAALAAIAARAGSRVSCVRCHGALGLDVAYDERTAQVAARTLYRFDRTIALVCMAASPGARVARDCGLPVIEEACANRGYDRHGRVMPLGHPHAPVGDPSRAVEQFTGIALHGRVRTVDGELLALRADSFCLRGDTPAALAVAAAVVQSAKANGLPIRPPSR